MLRGAIDVANRTRVSGWMMSPLASVRGQTVSAFVGARCVGSGPIEVARPDLLWLVEDGFAGFDFAIELSPDEDAASIVIRLQNCDAAILQANAELVRARPEEARRRTQTDAVGANPTASPIPREGAARGGVVLSYGTPKRSSGPR